MEKEYRIRSPQSFGCFFSTNKHIYIELVVRKSDLEGRKGKFFKSPAPNLFLQRALLKVNILYMCLVALLLASPMGSWPCLLCLLYLPNPFSREKEFSLDENRLLFKKRKIHIGAGLKKSRGKIRTQNHTTRPL